MKPQKTFVLLLFFAVGLYYFSSLKEMFRHLGNEESTDYFAGVTLPDFTYQNGVIDRRGAFIYALQYKYIADSLEKVYKLPKDLKGILLAIGIRESTGLPFVMNSSDEFGLGFCHMQPSTAHALGLKTFKGCKKLVCPKHSKEFRGVMAKHDYKVLELMKHDERLDIVKNLDATARMLCNPSKDPNLDQLEKMLAGYHSYTPEVVKAYAVHIRRNLADLNNPEFMAGVADYFEKSNEISFEECLDLGKKMSKDLIRHSRQGFLKF